MQWGRTQVSQTNPTIRRIVAVVPHEELGKRFQVDIVEVPTNWHWTIYFGEVTRGFYLDMRTLGSRSVPLSPASPPKFVGAQNRYAAPSTNEVLVRIVLPHDLRILVREDAFDSSAISVATDALLERAKRAAIEAVSGMGAMSGLALAVAEAQARALGKREHGIVPKHKRKALQLEREIEEAIKRRVAPSHLRKPHKPASYR